MPAPFSGGERRREVVERGSSKKVNSIQNRLNFVRIYPCLLSKMTFLFNLFIVEKNDIK